MKRDVEGVRRCFDGAERGARVTGRRIDAGAGRRKNAAGGAVP